MVRQAGVTIDRPPPSHLHVLRRPGRHPATSSSSSSSSRRHTHAPSIYSYAPASSSSSYSSSPLFLPALSCCIAIYPRERLRGRRIDRLVGMDMHHGHGDMRRPAHEAALRAVQKPPAKPWRGGSGAAAVPVAPKVYRVEPREFRDLVQRLTGAPARQQHHHHQAVAVEQPVPVRAGEEAQFYAGPWLSFPLLSPASMAGLDAHYGNGAFI